MRGIIVVLMACAIFAGAADVFLTVVETNKNKPVKDLEVAFRSLEGGQFGELMKPGKTDKNGLIKLELGLKEKPATVMLYFAGKTDDMTKGLEISAGSGNNSIKVKKSKSGYKIISQTQP